MSEMISHPSDYGIYIVDRRLKSVEESCQQLTDFMVEFCQKSRRQRINQRNRTERLSDLLDWKRMGLEYVKARWVAIRRKWPDLVVGMSSQEELDAAGGRASSEIGGGEFYDDDMTSRAPYALGGYESDANPMVEHREDLSSLRYHQKVPRPASAPGSPKVPNNAVNALFDDDEEYSRFPRSIEDSNALVDALRALAVKGTRSDYIPPTSNGNGSGVKSP
jgi:glycogen(starch) synthase